MPAHAANKSWSVPDSPVKYGTDAYDQWSVDELLTLARGVAAQAF